MPPRRANMRPNGWADKRALRTRRKRIAVLFSQRASMGIERLHARTNAVLELKLYTALLAMVVSNAR